MRKLKALAGVIGAILMCGPIVCGNIGNFDIGSSLTASASDVYSSGDYEYQLLGASKIMITDYKGSDIDVTIPSEIDGYKVTLISEGAFLYAKQLESVSIPEGVTFIYDSAFKGLENLKSVELPDSLQSIGSSTFAYCKSLDNVVIPKNIWQISSSTFSNCESLKNIQFLGEITEVRADAFEGTAWLDQIRANGELAIINNLVVDGKGLQGNTVTIPDGIKKISDGAFKNMTTIETVNANNELETIGSNAFEGCTNLTNLNLNSSIKYISDKAFANTSIAEIPNEYNLMDLATRSSAFDNTPLLTSRQAKNEFIIRAHCLVDYNNVTKTMEVPYGVRYISEDAFSGTSNALQEITLPRTLKVINRMFDNCKQLNKITLKATDCEINCGTLRTSCHIYGYNEELLAELKEALGPLSSYTLLGDVNRGDLSNDGDVSLADLILLRKYLLGADKTCPSLEDADFNCDMKINVFDFVAMERYIMGE